MPHASMIRRCLFIFILAAAVFYALGASPARVWCGENQPVLEKDAGQKGDDIDSDEEDGDLEEDTDEEESGGGTTVPKPSGSAPAIPKFEEEWSMEKDTDKGPEKPSLTWHTLTEFENLINTRQEDEFRDAYEKNEISTRVDLTYGTSNTFLKSVTDVYVMPTFINDAIGDEYKYSEDTQIERNLRISGHESEINFRELYLNYPIPKGHIRAGNQVYAWGTADFINSTAYINPRDLRELIFIDEDQLKLGVPSVSGMLFFDKMTLETVWIPVHVPAAIPPTGNFWSVKRVDDDFPLVFDDSRALPAESKNFGYAARASSSIKGFDFSFSGYHGPDTDQVLRPYSTVTIPDEPLGVRIRPYYDRVDYVGFDFSTARGDFVFQVEGAYSPNKSGFVEQNGNDPASLDFPFEVERADYYSYSVGFNYFIPMEKLLPGHPGDSLFTMEWYQAGFVKSNIAGPLIPDSLVLRYQDDFFDKRVHVSLSNILGIGDDGVIFWPQLSYDFKNGFKLVLDYAAINGKPADQWEDSTIFYFFRENDFIMVTLQYAYP